MSGPRDLTLSPEQRRLKRASKELVRAVGGTGEAAEITGGRQQRMSDIGLANTPDFLRLDEIQQLEDEAIGVDGWPPVTRALARHHGFILVRVPARPAAADWHREMGELSGHAGEVVQTICVSLTDGKVVAAEATAIRAKVAEAQEALAALDALCAQVEAEG